MPRRLESAIRRSGIAALVGLPLAAVPGFGQRLGLDGWPAQQSFPVKVTGTLPQPSVSQNRRYVEPPDR